MGKSKEEFEKVYFISMPEDIFMGIPFEYRQRFSSVRTDYKDSELFKDDEEYLKLMKNYRKSKKDFEDYKYNKRNNHKY